MRETDSETANRKSAPWLKPYHFQPGQSGNPSGRPAKPLTERLLNRLLAEDGEQAKLIVEAWLEKAKSGDIPAINSIRDTAEGRPTETFKFDGSIGISDEENAQRIAELVAEAISLSESGKAK